jgi:hypothetical protein
MQQRTQLKSGPAERAGGKGSEQDPALIARRELVEWCHQHQLPVPEEKRAQPSAR